MFSNLPLPWQQMSHTHRNLLMFPVEQNSYLRPVSIMTHNCCSDGWWQVILFLFCLIASITTPTSTVVIIMIWIMVWTWNIIQSYNRACFFIPMSYFGSYTVLLPFFCFFLFCILLTLLIIIIIIKIIKTTPISLTQLTFTPPPGQSHTTRRWFQLDPFKQIWKIKWKIPCQNFSQGTRPGTKTSLLWQIWSVISWRIFIVDDCDL